MGGSWFADDDGRFEMQVADEHGNVLGTVSVGGLEPGQELYKDLLRGRDR